MALVRSSARLACATSLLLSTGCGAEPETTPSESIFSIRTDDITVPAGAERYMCWAQTLDRDLAIDRFDYTQTNTVHHLLLARTTTEEQDGLSECEVLFRSSWVPLFGAGNGDAHIEAPGGSGHILPKGTQLLIQLHLLNTDAKDATTSVEVKMREAATAEVAPIGLYAFGTNDITLAPAQIGSITNDCTVEHDVDIFAWWPHMHRFGVSLRLEIGPSASALEEVYRIDPWDFDNQEMTAAPLHIPAGSFSRISCEYDNPSDQEVIFGESSGDEMCFLSTFATAAPESLDGCVYLKPVGEDPVPPDPAAGTCGEHDVSAIGVGATCTQGGGECAQGLSCTLDQGAEPPGFCLKLGCDTTADCGGNWATCCAPKEAGGLLNICIPEACRPADCIPKN